ncbi:DUF1922 domain-containing protein [Mycolicibacter minnesotensis]
MITCQHCKRPTQLFLCDDCTDQLHDMLTQIPWLLQELDARIQKLDRLPYGTIGRTRAPANQLSVIDFDAVETARNVRKLLRRWVETIAQRHTGRKPPGLDTVTTPDLARWLRVNTKAIARLDLAHKGRHQLYDDINRLVGGDSRGGQLVNAINRYEKHFAGPCPTIVGRDRDGQPRQCDTTLYADTYDRTVTCPTCDQDIDVEQNRRRAAAERDLHTRTDLLDVLANIDEPVTEEQLDRWIPRRLRHAGWLHDGTIIEFRIHPNDEPVYSVERARKLRRRDQHLTRRKSHT